MKKLSALLVVVAALSATPSYGATVRSESYSFNPAADARPLCIEDPGNYLHQENLGAVCFDAVVGARTVKIEISDTTASPVYVFYTWDDKWGNPIEVDGSFCGTRNIGVPDNAGELRLRMAVGLAAAICLSDATALGVHTIGTAKTTWN